MRGGGAAVKKRGLGDALLPGQLVRCIRCGKRHRVLKPSEAEQKLDQIRCSRTGELIVVGLEGRYLPPAN
jgi:DNA-directed RNA polymerase subunit RPC12/RpoP